MFSFPGPLALFTVHSDEMRVKKHLDLVHKSLWLVVNTSGLCHISSCQTLQLLKGVGKIWYQMIGLILV